MKKYITQKALITTIISLILIITPISILTKKFTILTIIVGISLIILIFLLIKNDSNKVFLTDIKSEIKSINWPSKKEINQSMLIITSIIILSGLILWIIDSILIFLISKII